MKEKEIKHNKEYEASVEYIRETTPYWKERYRIATEENETLRDVVIGNLSDELAVYRMAIIPILNLTMTASEEELRTAVFQCQDIVDAASKELVCDCENE